MSKINLLLLLAMILATALSSHAQSDSNDFYDTERVQDVHITFKQKNWQYVLDSLKVNGEEYLLAHKVRVGTSEYMNVGIRYAGSKSFTIGGDRNSLNIKLNQINKDQNHQGVQRIRLSNALRDPSMVREVLGYEIARKYMHAPKANFARLHVNGEFRGVYANVEYVDGNFLEDRFGDASGTLFQPIAADDKRDLPEGCLKNVSGALLHEADAACYMGNYELISENGWDDIMKLTDILNHKTKDIEGILDVDQVLWMHAFNNVLVNLNSYAGDKSENFFMYKHPEGKFTPIVRDLNLCFGSYKLYKMRSSDLTLEELQNLDPLLHADTPSKPLISKLLADDYYKKLYLSHIKTILEDFFVEGQYELRAKELQGLIANDMARDRYQYYKPEEFKTSLVQTHGKRSKIPGLVELMSKRARALKKHEAIRAFAPEIEEVQFATREKFARKEVKAFRISAKVEKHAKKVRLYYRFDASDKFQMAFMVDDGNNYDAKAGDKVFGLELKPDEISDDTQLEYYIIAENAAGVTCYPSNYMFEAKSITLKELNE